ncbi:MAG: helix-turn-helix transcriptional regulator [Bacteroidetes bacterium]|jgi:DNA-binding transcriptional ArsR family regulator|nr:helix-turn-helix transcriptional regulator [Bacteroidota bacterium]MBP7256714.1 helix-turn-helix transcriptional regulator [Chitinophagales bacterium]MBK7139269.1 helix-turn-helix transcriptional regulator [Bacteroidota bacterium]MBK7503831.1 helix-turn-helix transcriptional regulator [Bacteroidota bacterium]MBK8674098.1 helix-turn-helix transcriptional regulator [Bacteroidota bacterium]
MNFDDLNLENLSKSLELLRAVAHPIRLAIIDLLDEEQQLNVNRIYAQLGMEQSITSQHLKVLRDTDVVITKREGKMIFYTLNYPKLQSISKGVSSFDLITKERQKKLRKSAVTIAEN